MIIQKQDWNEYLKKNTLIKVFKSRDTNEFLLGYLIKDIGQYYIFQSIDEYGYLDGYVLYQKDTIQKIEDDDNYTRVFKFYIDYLKQGNGFDQLGLEEIYNKIPKKNINTILKYCLSKQFILTIGQTKDDYYETGQIISFDSQSVILDQQTYCKDLGIKHEDGNFYTQVSDIQTIDLVNKGNYLYQQYTKRKDQQ